MNDEIKEILDWLKDEDIYLEDYGYQYKRISLKETKQLLDYITNLQQDTEMYAQLKDEYEEEIKELQQENERLKENNSNMQEEMARVWEENERLNLELSGYREAILRDDKLLGLQDYKSRCEKAIEYIDKQKKKMYKSRNKIALFILMKLENILQNGSDSQ